MVNVALKAKAKAEAWTFEAKAIKSLVSRRQYHWVRHKRSVWSGDVYDCFRFVDGGSVDNHHITAQSAAKCEELQWQDTERCYDKQYYNI